MNELKKAAAEFLALRRIAVVGVSRSPDQTANYIYRKLRTPARRVFPVNPNAQEVEGERCYPDVGSIPGGVDGAVVVTAPAVVRGVIEDCGRAGVRNVWLHRAVGEGSVSPEALERCRELGLNVIPGACPVMYCRPVDPGHRCMRFVLGIAGKLPRPQPAA
jgi:predicted CoA-binding protein